MKKLIATAAFVGLLMTGPAYAQSLPLIPTVNEYIINEGGYGGGYGDTNPYPSSYPKNSNGCAYSFTGISPPVVYGNCITDAQIQAEVISVLKKTGWLSGLNNMFIVYTPPGEGICFDTGGVRPAALTFITVAIIASSLVAHTRVLQNRSYTR